MSDRFDELPPAFQRYAHDEYLGGEGARLRGISREERELYYGDRDLTRTLKCSKKLKEYVKGREHYVKSLD